MFLRVNKNEVELFLKPVGPVNVKGEMDGWLVGIERFHVTSSKF